MATIKAVIVPAKVLKNGKHKIRISIAHNCETRYLLTNITVDSIKEFKNGVIIKRPDASHKNILIKELIIKYQNIIDDIDYIDGITCGELVSIIKRKNEAKNITIQQLFNEYITTKTAKDSTIQVIKYQFATLKKQIDPNMPMKNINHSTVLILHKKLYKKGLSNHTILNIVVLLKSLINYAVTCGYVEYKINPFFGYKLPHPNVRDIWLSTDEVKTIRDFKSDNEKINTCRDLFMLSYYLGGINICDLLSINFNVNKNRLSYVRTKTENLNKVNKTVEFDIPDEAKEIINKLIGKDGHIAINARPNKDGIPNIFRYFKKIRELTGINKIMYYSARKSFSQHAFNIGISTSVIDYILGHKLNVGGTSLYHYISVTPELASDAIRKVLDNLK